MRRCSGRKGTGCLPCTVTSSRHNRTLRCMPSTLKPTCLWKPPQGALSPEVPEPLGRQLSVANGMLDILVTQVGLQGARIMAFVGEGEAAGVPQHVRVCLEAEPGFHAGALDHAGKACRRERRTTLRCEHKW